MGRKMERQARPDAFPSRFGLSGKYCIIQGGVNYVWIGIDGKIGHTGTPLLATRFNSFDEADVFWQSKLNSTLDAVILEMK